MDAGGWCALSPHYSHPLTLDSVSSSYTRSLNGCHDGRIGVGSAPKKPAELRMSRRPSTWSKPSLSRVGIWSMTHLDSTCGASFPFAPNMEAVTR